MKCKILFGSLALNSLDLKKSLQRAGSKKKLTCFLFLLELVLVTLCKIVVTVSVSICGRGKFNVIKHDTCDPVLAKT